MRQAKHTGIAVYLALLLVCCGAARSAGSQANPAPVAKPQQAPAATDAKKAVLDDTDHLVQLARELKADVEKTRRDELSLQVVREADEIEKLARSVKARIH